MPNLVPDHVLLGLIAAELRYGYQLLECFRDPAHLGRVWSLSTSQLYAVLKRLDGQGHITGASVPSADGPPRTEYALTEAGQEQVEAWLHNPSPSPSVRAVRVEFLSRLYVARLLNRSTTAMVAAQRAACRAERDRLLAQLDATSVGVERLAVEFVISQLDAILDWIERCEMTPKSR
jgi:DNA-binding PadR family transcriptional regulator